jgi:hypothetical protein
MSAAAVGALSLAGCSAGPVDVVDPEPTGAAASECRAFLRAMPEELVDEERRDVSPDGATAAAWGDPAIVVRCGVDEPGALTPSSRCDVINDVGWFAEELDSELRFTTIGRSVHLEVTVPDDYSPAADVLVKLAEAVTTTTTELHPCR